MFGDCLVDIVKVLYESQLSAQLQVTPVQLKGKFMDISNI